MTSHPRLRSQNCFGAVIVCTVLTAGIGGCSASPSAGSTPPGTAMNITGNWELAVKTMSGGVASIAVYLTSTAGNVSGFAVGPAAVDNVCTSNGCCGGPIGLFNEALTGTIDTGGALKLGTAIAGNPAFAMTGTVSGSTLSNGSFTLAGACTTQGTVTGVEYPPLDGTYSGELTSKVMGQSFSVSEDLKQNSAPNSNGDLGLGGTVNVTGYACASSGNAALFALNSTYLGSFFSANLTPSSGATLFLLNTLSPDGKTLQINYGFAQSGNSCNGDYGSGTLTLE